MNETFDESVRRGFVAQNTAAVESDNPESERQRLQAIHGKDNVWNTSEATELFEFISFLAPFAVVTRKSDGVKGCLEFQDYPRFYFRFTAK